MKSIEQPLPGVHLIEPKIFSDQRGDFVKTFHAPHFTELGITFLPVEEFFSTSNKGVLRGMHFQLPPFEHAKLVYCIQGAVLDVLLDLRKASESFGAHASAELSSLNRRMFFMPPGIAHGFLALVDNSIMVYKTSAVHAPVADSGVRWDSFNFNWPVADPMLSARDLSFRPFGAENLPF